jgi:Asp-tRNA(Asn)/Glu-tRNA(Gln) amidotransferase C subunit
LNVFGKDLGWDFGSVAHVSVTQELTFELQIVGARRAIPLDAIIDAFEFSLMRNGGLSPDTFPGPPEGEMSEVAVPFPGWLDKLMAWYDEINRSELSLNIQIREAIEESLRRLPEVSPELHNVFDSGGAIAKAIREMIVIGLRPENLRPRSYEGEIAKKIWSEVAQRIPDIHVLLDYLFIDHNSPKCATDSQRAKNHLELILRKAFGFEPEEPIRIAYHGFYFYSPLQWSMFQLMSYMGVEQVFVVHDDKVGSQFEIWRRFFFEGPHMTQALTTTQTVGDVDPRAAFLSNVLAGERPNLPDNLTLRSFRSSTDLARHVRRLDTEKTSGVRVQRQVFAAAASDLNRKIARFERISGEKDDRKLLHLPIGRFLLGLQECIRVTADDIRSGLDFSVMSHLVEGGFLNAAESSNDRPLPEVLSLCEVYFSGCKTLDDWSTRMVNLEAYYEPQSHGFAQIIKRDYFPLRAISRPLSLFLRDSVKNHLRRAPWLDLSMTEWQSLKGTIRTILQAIEQLTGVDQVGARQRIDELVNVVRSSVVAENLYGNDEWSNILGVLDRLPRSPNIHVHISRMSEILPIVLGKQIDYGRTEIWGSRVEAGLVYSLSAPLRGLEACGFVRKRKIHLANLSDAVFPRQPRLFSWPFHRDELEIAAGDEALQWRIRIVDEIDRSGGLGDLYLLWLALNGSEGEVVLSWISEVAGEKLNPSPLLALLLAVRARPEVRTFARGVIVSPSPAMPRWGDAQTKTPVVRTEAPDSVALNGLFSEIRSREFDEVKMALASAAICARRTAIHWLLAPFSSYRSRWQLGILYGNLLGLPHKEIWKGRPSNGPADWKRLLDSLWIWMTDAERERTSWRSSINQRNDEHGTAKPPWLLTLEGAYDRKDRLSAAYLLAMKAERVRRNVGQRLLGETGNALPKPHFDDLEDDDLFGDTRNQMWYLCDRCPISDRCLERKFRPE